VPLSLAAVSDSSSVVHRSSTAAPLTAAADNSPIHGHNLQPIFEQEEDKSHDGSNSFLCDEYRRSTQDQSLVPQPRAHQNIKKEW
jgi:hypothetical protein